MTDAVKRRWPRVTLPMIRVILTDHTEAAKRDESAATGWHEGKLSPRQSAGFYEIRPERYAFAMGLYRARVKLIDKVAKWRRANPEPSAHHTVLTARSTGAITLRVGSFSEPWREYHWATRVYAELSKAKQAKTEPPKEPARGPREEAHDTTWQGLIRDGYECPLCRDYKVTREAWAARRRVFMAGQGIDVGNVGYHGQPSTQWPDGSWSTDLNYQPLPIRSSRAVPRTNLKKEESE